MAADEHPCSCQLCQPTITVDAQSADVSVSFQDAVLDRREETLKRRQLARLPVLVPELQACN